MMRIPEVFSRTIVSLAVLVVLDDRCLTTGITGFPGASATQLFSIGS